MEAGICLAATLLPAIERVEYVTILPSVKSPVGRTVLEPNVGRHTTGAPRCTLLCHAVVRGHSCCCRRLVCDSIAARHRLFLFGACFPSRLHRLHRLPYAFWP